MDRVSEVVHYVDALLYGATISKQEKNQVISNIHDARAYLNSMLEELNYCESLVKAHPLRD